MAKHCLFLQGLTYVKLISVCDYLFFFFGSEDKGHISSIIPAEELYLNSDLRVRINMEKDLQL